MQIFADMPNFVTFKISENPNVYGLEKIFFYFSKEIL
tara:strand:+ start:4878 stop:4988 length:111 start_codon:yes stop_codon:yes gene_type:complete